MKLLRWIVIIILVLFFLGAFSQWKFFLQPFSKECGYSSFDPNVSQQMSCGCSGFAFSELTIGSTNNYCLGSCNACECSHYYSANNSRKIVDCSVFSNMSGMLN